MSEPTSRSRRKFTVDALFTDTRPQATGVRDLTDAKLIDLDRIEPDPLQPRRTFDPDRLAELAASIRIEGVLQPIVVRFDAEADRYIIVHGERRWRASREAGLSIIPAIVRDVPAERRLVQQLMENVVRDDLNAIDRAAALRTLREQLDDPPWETVAETIGIGRSRLFQLLGTEKLPTAAQDDIRSGRLSEKQSRALQGLPPDRQEVLRDLIVTEQIPAPEAMRLARAFREATVAEGEDLATALNQIREFIFGTSAVQVRAQSRALLTAIRDAQSGSKRSREQLATLSSTLNTGRFRGERFTTEVNRLARSLATVPPAPDRDPDTEAALRELRDALDSLLS